MPLSRHCTWYQYTEVSMSKQYDYMVSLQLVLHVQLLVKWVIDRKSQLLFEPQGCRFTVNPEADYNV